MERKAKKIKYIVIIITISLIVITIILTNKKSQNGQGLYTMLGINKQDTENSININSGNQTYNLTGIHENVIKFEDWIIYSHGADASLNAIYNSPKEGIFKHNIKTGQTIQLSNYNGMYFNIHDDNLYYIDKFNTINIINIQTLNKESISWINHNTYKASYLIVLGNDIYYREQNGGNIYKTNRKGSTFTLVAEYTTGDIQIYNNCIYYIDANSHNLFKKELYTDSIPTKIIDDKISNFCCLDNKIVYISNSNLKIFDCNNNTSKTLKKEINSNFVIDNNNIYIANNKNIIEINIDNIEEKNVFKTNEKIYRLQIYDNNMFYYYSTGYPYINTSINMLDIQTKKAKNINFNT